MSARPRNRLARILCGGGSLLLVGAAAGCIGAKLFRWDNGGQGGRPAHLWVVLALFSWMAVGGAAIATGHLTPVLPEPAAFATITDAQIAAIAYGDLPGDSEFVTPMTPPSARGHHPKQKRAVRGEVPRTAGGEDSRLAATAQFLNRTTIVWR